MDQKKIFNPKIWLTLFAAGQEMFAIWALMAGFASDAEIVEWLIEDGLPTDQIVVDEMKSAMFFLGVMAISIVPPFIATAFLLEETTSNYDTCLWRNNGNDVVTCYVW